MTKLNEKSKKTTLEAALYEGVLKFAPSAQIRQDGKGVMIDGMLDVPELAKWLIANFTVGNG